MLGHWPNLCDPPPPLKLLAPYMIKKNHCNAVEGSAHTCTAMCASLASVEVALTFFQFTFFLIRTDKLTNGLTDIAVYRGSALPKNNAVIKSTSFETCLNKTCFKQNLFSSSLNW